MPDVTEHKTLADLQTLADQQMLERALKHDARAVSELHKKLDPVIRLTALRALKRYKGNRNDTDLCRSVDDLAQDVWERLFANNARDLRNWAPALGRGLRGYIALVANRDVLDKLRRGQPPVVGPLNGDEDVELHTSCRPSPEFELASREMLVRVVDSLRAELSARGAAIFELLIVEEQPVEHVCKVMNMSPDAVFQWRHRIAHRARQIAKTLSQEAAGP